MAFALDVELGMQELEERHPQVAIDLEIEVGVGAQRNDALDAHAVVFTSHLVAPETKMVPIAVDGESRHLGDEVLEVAGHRLDLGFELQAIGLQKRDVDARRSFHRPRSPPPVHKEGNRVKQLGQRNTVERHIDVKGIVLRQNERAGENLRVIGARASNSDRFFVCDERQCHRRERVVRERQCVEVDLRLSNRRTPRAREARIHAQRTIESVEVRGSFGELTRAEIAERQARVDRLGVEGIASPGVDYAGRE